MKLKFLTPILFLSLILLNSCSKEDAIANDVANSTQEIQKVVFNLPGNGRNPETTTTMLQFVTYEEYESTIEMLITSVETYEEAFYSQYQQLSDDELDDVIDALGFDEDQPLIDFENNLGFINSKRKHQRSLEDAWLLTDDLNPETDPDKGNVFDSFEATLLNDNGEIMIAGKVYSFDKMVYDYEIVSDYENSLIKINNGEDVTNDPNINSISRDYQGICRLAGSSEDYVPFPSNPNRRVKRKLTFHHNMWGKLITKTVIKSYKKK